MFISKTTEPSYTVSLRKIRWFTTLRWFTILLEMLITPALILMCILMIIIVGSRLITSLFPFNVTQHFALIESDKRHK